METSAPIDRNLQKKYGIKPCLVMLNREMYSKIRIKCTVDSSEENEQFTCILNQVSNNVFSIKIKRKFVDDADTIDRGFQCKIQKISKNLTIINTEKSISHFYEEITINSMNTNLFVHRSTDNAV